MYVPRHFNEARRDVLLDFVRKQPFGLLIASGESGLEVASIPFLVESKSHEMLLFQAHVARANPIWRGANASEVVVVFQGPHAYVSPNWYPSKAESGEVVPTWNYVMVEARGTLTVRDDVAWLREHVTRLTETHERDQPRPWAVDDAPREFTDKLLKGVVGLELSVSSLVGKWKLSQNRSEPDRAGVARSLAQRDEAGARAVADWMHELEPGRSSRD
jgi:transcriptional regulator